MRRPISLTMLFALLVAGSCSALLAQDLDTFQVPDLAPPSAPEPDGEVLPDIGEAMADEEAIPAPMVYGPATASLIDLMPVPYPHPGAHLWAGRCDGRETLVKSPCPPAWASVDALWLQRDGVDGDPLAIDLAAQVVLRADDFDFNYETGVRVIYGEVINCIPFELTYLGMHDWNSSISVDGVDLVVPFGPTGGAFEDADVVDANYASELHSIELNVLKVEGCKMTWMGGVRYVDAEEDFLLRIHDGNPANLDGLLAVTTDNRLLGLQLGVDAQYNCDCWTIGLVGKAGVYANFAERDLALRDNAVNPDLIVETEGNSSEVAFVGEAILGVTRHLGCGLRLRGGYQLLWMQGLALAPEQLGNTAGGANFSPPAVDADGSILYDGGYVGLEWHR